MIFCFLFQAYKLHSYSSFDALLSVWEEYEWLRKFSWYRSEVLPKEKKLYAAMSDKYMNDLMVSIYFFYNFL